MASSLKNRIIFCWPVSRQGYFVDVFKDAIEDATDMFITDGLELGLDTIAEDRQEVLKKDPALFLKLAYLENDKDKLIQFANENGLLGGDLECAIIPIDVDRTGLRDEAKGEPIEQWFEEVGSLRKAVDTWFEYLRLIGVRPEDGEESRSLRVDPRAQEQLDTSRFGTSARALASYLRNTITERLAAGVKLEAITTPDREKAFIGLYLRPQSLLSAVWLQFAMAVEETKEFKRCVICGSWMEVTPTSRRASAKYCSNKCRTEAYRKRQVAARELHDKGMSPTDIAREFATDVNTVKNWIGK